MSSRLLDQAAAAPLRSMASHRSAVGTDNVDTEVAIEMGSPGGGSRSGTGSASSSGRASGAQALVSEKESSSTVIELDADSALRRLKMALTHQGVVDRSQHLANAVKVGHVALQMLADHVANGRLTVRLDALRGLRAAGSAASPFANVVVDLLQDSLKEMREAAALTLGELGSAAAPVARDALTVACQDKSWSVRVAAVRAVGSVLGTSGVGQVASMLGDSSQRVRATAAAVLADMGPCALPHVAELEAMEKSVFPSVRDASRRALVTVRRAGL